MKKMYTLTICLCLSAMAMAQNFTSIWQKNANGTDYPWFGTASAINNTVTSCDYNPVTDKLLVCQRGTAIYIINASTGAQEGTLSTTGIGGESFKYTKVRVTSTGVIYAISL